MSNFLNYLVFVFKLVFPDNETTKVMSPKSINSLGGVKEAMPINAKHFYNLPNLIGIDKIRVKSSYPHLPIPNVFVREVMTGNEFK